MFAKGTQGRADASRALRQEAGTVIKYTVNLAGYGKPGLDLL